VFRQQDAPEGKTRADGRSIECQQISAHGHVRRTARLELMACWTAVTPQRRDPAPYGTAPESPHHRSLAKTTHTDIVRAHAMVEAAVRAERVEALLLFLITWSWPAIAAVGSLSRGAGGADAVRCASGAGAPSPELPVPLSASSSSWFNE
jgi:hypothetical protein